MIYIQCPKCSYVYGVYNLHPEQIRCQEPDCGAVYSQKYNRVDLSPEFVRKAVHRTVGE